MVNAIIIIIMNLQGWGLQSELLTDCCAGPIHTAHCSGASKIMFSYRTLEITPWKDNFDSLDIIVTAKTIGNTEVILDKNIQSCWGPNGGTPSVMNVEWVIMMMILMILNIDRGIDKKIMIDH